jgi:hypothetical protein
MNSSKNNSKNKKYWCYIGHEYYLSFNKRRIFFAKLIKSSGVRLIIFKKLISIDSPWRIDLLIAVLTTYVSLMILDNPCIKYCEFEWKLIQAQRISADIGAKSGFLNIAEYWTLEKNYYYWIAENTQCVWKFFFYFSFFYKTNYR